MTKVIIKRVADRIRFQIRGERVEVCGDIEGHSIRYKPSAKSVFQHYLTYSSPLIVLQE